MNIIKKDETFKNNPLPVFVKDLRNYTLHYALPATFAQMEVSQDAQTKKQIITTHAFLNKKSLLHGCVIRSMSASESGASRPPNLEHVVH